MAAEIGAGLDQGLRTRQRRWVIEVQEADGRWRRRGKPLMSWTEVTAKYERLYAQSRWTDVRIVVEDRKC